jgi:2-(1,2-epoxy-1,2-dihydrophenyl)acetyl-CoA isomerase
MRAMEDTLLVAREGRIATLTLNRPQVLNTLDFALMEALVARIGEVAQDSEIRCVIVNGAGRHFMAGGDLRAFASRLDRPAGEFSAQFTLMVDRLHACIETLQRMDKPVIASVHGAVAGFGLSLMLACDLAIAGEDAYFTSAYRAIALTPDGGLTYTLPRLVGAKRAMEIVLLGDRFDARKALELGLVNRIVPSTELESATRELAQRLASGPARALGSAKRLLTASWNRTLAEQLHAEAESFGRCSAHADFAEGLQAFFEKRPARFQ